MPRIQKQRKHEERERADNHLNAISSNPSSLSAKTMDSDCHDTPQPMANPKLQLKRANTYGFNFANHSNGALGHTNTSPERSTIQAKTDGSVIQRQLSAREAFPYIHAGKQLEPFDTWRLNQLFDHDPNSHRVRIVNMTKFKIFCHFVEHSYGDDNTNCIFLLSRLNRYKPYQLLAIAEKICLNTHISSTRYQGYLPQIQYPTDTMEAADINAGGPHAVAIKTDYEALIQALQGNDKAARATARENLANTLGDTVPNLMQMMRGDFGRFKASSFDAIYPAGMKGYEKEKQRLIAKQKHKKLSRALKGVGGARKARILGRLHYDSQVRPAND